MTSLYEISGNIKQIEDLLDQMDENDATFETVVEYLNGLNTDLNDKVENIVKFIKNLEANADMYKAEKQRLDKLEKSAKKKAEGLQEYLSTMLMSLGYDHKNKRKVQTSIGNIGFKKLPPKLEIINLDKVPVEFDKPMVRDESSIRKADLLKYAKSFTGDLTDKDEVILESMGIKIVNNNSSLQIK
jgi:hypothetical protein